jgi:formylmethanofuran dehydrogenase subunit B
VADDETRGAAARAPGGRGVERATCLGCGCACDDVDVVVAGGRIVDARRACALGRAWFGDGVVPAAARAGGRDASVDEAIAAAARLLAGAARPLVFLAPELSCEAQGECVALADLLGAALDSVTTATAGASVLATQERGRAGATLGEVRNRADVLVFWGVDPLERYPRYPTRYAPEPVGTHVPDGRRSRTVVAVDVGEARGPADADHRVAVAAADEVATLTARRAIAATAVAGTPPAAPAGAPGHAWERAAELAPLLVAARYLVLVADAEPSPGRDPGRAAAAVALAQALNGPTRCALSTLRGGGNRSGADGVLTSQTGYPMAVDFARGFPRYRPHDGSAAALLARGEVDAVLLVGSPALVPDELRAALAAVPCVAIGPRASEAAPAAAALVDAGVAGIHHPGTALRMDDVPLPLRPSRDGPPSPAALVRALRDAVAALAGAERAS